MTMKREEGDSKIKDDWPLYSLANYQAGGLLLRLLNPGIDNQRPASKRNGRPAADWRQRRGDHLATSGYQTDDSSQQQANRKWRRGESELLPTWLQLVDSEQQGGGLKKDSSRTLELLCSNLHQVISPFLVQSGGRLLSSSRSLQHQELEVPGKSKYLHQNTVERRSSAAEQRANWRRLSWRRRNQLEPLELVNKPTEVAKQEEDGGRKWTGSWLDGFKPEVGLNPRARWSRLPTKRGQYGESLVHVLIVAGANSSDHLLLLILILHLWPGLVADIFESHKFYGLSLLHLAVAYNNQRLLEHLIRVCSTSGNNSLLEQQATGSLFAVPNLGETRESSIDAEDVKRSHFRFRWWLRRRVGAKAGSGDSKLYWCDRLDHWPTANGSTHLLLFDRLAARRAALESDATGGQLSSSEESETKLHTTCDEPVYLGATPLAWATSFRSRPMYSLLASAGAKLDAQDSEGNSCLHQLVINDSRGWIRFLAKSGSPLKLRNKHGLSAFLLSCHLGRAELFEEFLELSAVEFWSYSMISCRGYPLTELDSAVPLKTAETDHQQVNQSALSVILESEATSDEQKAQLLSSAVVKKLLEEKWKHFARRLFYRELLLALAHLSLMTLAISLREQTADEQLPAREPNDAISGWNGQSDAWRLRLISGFGSLSGQRLTRHLAEASTFGLSAHNLWRFGRELGGRSSSVRLQWTYNPLLPNLVAANSLILCCALMRLTGALCQLLPPEANADRWKVTLASAEDVALIFAAPLLWSSLLFFIAAFRVTGPFVAMIRHMIVRDLRQFSLIYLVFLYSFAQCIFFVNWQPPVASSADNGTISSSNGTTTRGSAGGFLFELSASYLRLWMDLFKMTLGVYELQPFRHSLLARLFLLLFIYLIPILFNMLIAMMNNTYSRIISQSERAWSFQWARTLFALERRLGAGERAAYLRLYSISMAQPNQSSGGEEQGGGSGSERQVPALMIIKRMKFTRAERRRLALAHWQRSIRWVLKREQAKVA